MNRQERHDIAKQYASLNAKIRKLETDKSAFGAALAKALERLAEPKELYPDGLVAQVVTPTRQVRDEKLFEKLAKALGFKDVAAFDERLEGCLVRVEGTAYVKVTT